MDNNFNNKGLNTQSVYNQPQQKKSNGTSVIIAILVVLVLALGGYIVYKEFIDKDNNNSNNNTNTNGNNTVSNKCNGNITGEYYGEKITADLNEKVHFTFKNDGTFTYYFENSEGSSGTYSIKDGVITLKTKVINGLKEDYTTSTIDISDDCSKFIYDDIEIKKVSNTNTQTEVKDFDLSKFDGSKAINGYTGYKYEISEYNDAKDSGITATLNSDKRSVKVVVNWNSCYSCGGSLTDDPNPVKTYTVSFNKNVKQIEHYEIRNSYNGVIYYLMEDGTVEFTPIKHYFYNNSYTNTSMKSYGKIDGVSNIVKLAFTDAVKYETDLGYGTSSEVAIKADGTFYDLTKMLTDKGYFE